LVFIVVDKKTGMKSLQIPVQWPARYVSSVQWLDDRFVVVRGEGAFLAILDVGSGKQTHNLVGSEFQVSPDETMIIYRSDFNPIRGYVPPERKSDCVLLTLVQRTPGSGSVNTNYKVIYPDPLSWGEDDLKIYSDFNQRHQIRSGLVWSIDNQMIAFVENNQQRLWLTVLKLESLNDAAGVNPRRFDLGPASEARFAVSWSEKMRVKIVGENTSLLVDLTSGTVTSLP